MEKMDENGDKAINHAFFQPFHTPVEPGNVQQPVSGAQTVCELATAWVKCLALAHLLLFLRAPQTIQRLRHWARCGPSED